MIYPILRKIAAIAAFTCIVSFTLAQDPGPKSKSSAAQKTESKPFRVLTNGQRITVQSNKDINKIIVWTASGNRFVEQINLGSPSYNFVIPSKEKYVFMMLELEGEKRYTEKIGVQ